MLGMGNKWPNCLTKFEGPDPDYYCAKGYAICNPDPRGITRSDGNITMIGSQEANVVMILLNGLQNKNSVMEKRLLLEHHI